MSLYDYGFIASGSVLNVCDRTAMNGDFTVVHGDLMQQVTAIRQEHGPSAADSTVSGAEVTPASLSNSSTGALASGVGRLISWLDSHAHLSSSHHCATSVRQAMEAAGISTADRPVSGDAGDYGPFLLRHGAQIIPQESYEPKAGDVAVYDRTEDHPAGHIQVFDGRHWVSDFVQRAFSPYRDPGTTPAVTIYRLS
jgi:hypothetical protein